MESIVNWQERALSIEEINQYLDGKEASDLAACVEALIEQQKINWPQLKEGYEALSRIETKRVNIDGSSLIVQHNARRVRSTAAAVDKTSIAARPCFLCSENLPDEERGIFFDEEYVILCNPFPVLDKHLVIAHKEHLEQKVEGRIEDLLALAFALGDAYFVLYNGPECGASAPDHLHFQALSRAVLPIEDNLKDADPPTEIDCSICADAERGQFELFTVADAGRSVIVFRGANQFEIVPWIYRIMAALSKATLKAEPMLNIVCYVDRGVYTVLLFPRARHRPACFFAEGEERLTISPGAVDMAGIIVVPEHLHYEKIGAPQIEKIFSEVSLRSDFIDEIVSQVCEA
jgi:hypothetical protein